MAAKFRVQPVSRVGLAPLVEMAEQLRAALPGWEDTEPEAGRGHAPSDLALDMAHLARHDADGLISVALGDEVVGFGAGFVRSRTLVLAPLWLLPEHERERSADVLLRRLLHFGERAGVADVAALLIGGPAQHALAVRFGLCPRFPVYRLLIDAERARHAGEALAKLMAGRELTEEASQARLGLGDLDRLDRLARAVTRPMDHEHWLVNRSQRLAVVRSTQRVAGYGYGSPGHCGPVAATTTEAALAALGWGLRFGAEGAERVSVLVPATFEAALEHLLAAGARCVAIGDWFTSHAMSGLERYVLGGTSLP
ncbi:MAG: hypothetical protein ACOY3Y_18655 [Acidobacteriota bacterium]